MTIRNLSDVNAAFDAGRFHVARYLKNTTANYSNWADISFASGQPAYDARVGSIGAFNPVVAIKNDAVWFPAIEAGMERYLAAAELRISKSTQGNWGSVMIFDLLGYYPLVDGDSTDLQEFDNTLTLPRYTDGVGVQAVIVSHIAPQIQAGLATIVYTDTNDQTQTITVDMPQPTNPGEVVSGARNSTGTALCSVHIPLTNGSKGIKNIQSVTYLTPPGGLHCIYLIKQLGTMVLGDLALAAEKSFYLEKGWAAPRIYDGAAINMFVRQSSTTVAAMNAFGTFTFIWG